MVYTTSQAYSFRCQAELQSERLSLLSLQPRSRQPCRWASQVVPFLRNTLLAPQHRALQRTASIFLVFRAFTFAHKILNHRPVKQRNSFRAYWEGVQTNQSRGRLIMELTIRAANTKPQWFPQRDLRQSQLVLLGRKL